MLLPVMRKARMASQQTACASNLRQMGTAILMYVNENGQRLPVVIEPFWKPGGFDLSADPSLPAEILSFYNVTKKYLQDMRVLICPGAVLGYPKDNPKMTYRVSAANNVDGRVQYVEELLGLLPNPQTGDPPTHQVQYNYSLKYLNGRHYELMHVNPRQIPLKLEKGVGDHYLARDLLRKIQPGEGVVNTPDTGTPPHPNRQYNILRLDLSVTLQRDVNFQLLHP
jgi:hypothetical protein